MKFRQFIISFCLLAMLVLPAFCFAADELKDANALYAKGKYKEAAKSYQSIVDEGYQSANLFYNLGNAYFKLGELPSSILYYEKARLLSPGDEDINFNIRFANAKTVDKIDEAPEFFLSKWWTGVILQNSADTLAIMAILLFLIGSAALITYFFAINLPVKKTSFFGAIILFAIGLFTIFLASSQMSYFSDNKQAIIFSSVVNVKSSPAAQASTVFILHDGTKVNLKETNGDWIRIKLANGNQGWLKANDIKEI